MPCRVEEVEEESGMVGVLQCNLLYGVFVSMTPPAPPMGVKIRVIGLFNEVLHHEGIAQHEDAVLGGVDVILEVQVLACAFWIIRRFISD